MKITRRLGGKGLVLMMSIFMSGVVTLPAQTDEPGPFERLFRAMRRGMSEPQHKSTTHRSSHKQNQDTGSPTPSKEGSSAPSSSDGTNKPPNAKNTRSTSRANAKKGDDLRYGTPVPGKPGFVTSPYSPNTGYIDVRGFAPGTPVKDPYSGKVFLTP